MAIETGAPSADFTDLYVILNEEDEARAFALPGPSAGFAWYRAVDTSLEPPNDAAEPGAEIRLDPQDTYHINGRSCVILVGR